ncbi:LysR family transcriptional regulator [Streptoalloteichus tenebrarius]|uniref:LysR family transcriptional regulator n=1 Tax=Streptoalloteichus tenebrarius (strain ATCC 17920 / DSM 40477 / JCM 4838 / CBS 697.72 / NBRC 16177 / NCIMB 11028 / NRRL B-12390 / A12253. 1 / ISP 5477) TaxID=1933 RepID=UPI0020A41D73|nr:LysR family transcriptional regulator [Streptoalloteichus tenebrarius]
MSTVPDLESLRLLVLVGELGSLGRAAGELGITQPAASKRLSALERQLRLVLVDRTRRGSRLTPAGHVVSDWARRVLDEVDGLLTGAAALRAHRDAELRVAASMTVAEHLAPGWIGELRRAEPALYVGLQVTNSTSVVELVRSGEVDMGFIESPSIPTDLAYRRVAVDRLAVVVAPTHPWTRRRRPVSPEELAATPLVVRESGSGTRETLERALAAARCGPAQPLLELGSTTAVRSAVIAGAGPAVLSVLAVATDLSEGRLVEVGVEGIDLRRALCAVWPSGRRLVGPAAALLAIAGRAGP